MNDRLKTDEATMTRVWNLAKRAEEALEQMVAAFEPDRILLKAAANLTGRIEMVADAAEADSYRRDFERISRFVEAIGILMNEMQEPGDADQHALHHIAARAVSGIGAYCEHGRNGIFDLPSNIGE